MNYMKLLLPFIFSTLVVAGPNKSGKLEHPIVAKAVRWVSFKQQASSLSHKELASLKKMNKDAQTGTLSQRIRSSSEPIICEVSQSSRSTKRSYDDTYLNDETPQNSTMPQLLTSLISQPIKEKAVIQLLSEELSKISCRDTSSMDM